MFVSMYICDDSPEHLSLCIFFFFCTCRPFSPLHNFYVYLYLSVLSVCMLVWVYLSLPPTLLVCMLLFVDLCLLLSNVYITKCRNVGTTPVWNSKTNIVSIQIHHNSLQHNTTNTAFVFTFWQWLFLISAQQQVHSTKQYKFQPHKNPRPIGANQP